MALKSEQPLDELNPANGPTAQASLELNLDQVDAADEDCVQSNPLELDQGPAALSGNEAYVIARNSPRILIRTIWLRSLFRQLGPNFIKKEL